MKRTLKRVALVLVALVALAILAAVVNFYALHPKSRAAPSVTAKATPEALARGAYLANSVAGCLACHSQVDEAQGDAIPPGAAGGGRDFKRPASASVKPRAPNLTPDKAHGIGSFTDGELLRAIREGIGHDGRALFPMMPYRTYGETLSDDDALAVIAYLRSLPPLSSDPGKTEIGFPISMFIRMAPLPVATPVGPPPADPLAHGQWLLKVASCGDCHDAFDDSHTPIPGKRLAGGTKFPIAKGDVYASNITADKATGIGAYADEDILKVINEGVNKSGRKLNVMPWMAYKGMTDADKKDLILALRAVPAVANVVPPSTVK